MTWPEAVAVGGEGGLYSSLRGSSRRGSRPSQLRSEDGAWQPGDRVALRADNSPAWVVANLAVLTVGATVVPLSTRWREAEVDDIVSRVTCRG